MHSESTSRAILWNPHVKLILSDVDETVADLYVDAEPEMIEALTTILTKGIPIFFITGQGIESVDRRILQKLPATLRSKTLVGHCNGAEVFGHTMAGERQSKPYYSVYEDTVNESQKHLWRTVIQQLIVEFKLECHPTMPVAEFKQLYGDNPLAVMLEDRGPQITFEFVNGADLSENQHTELEFKVPQTHGVYDLRIPVLERGDELLKQHQIPVTPRIAGVFALDFVVEGVSKTTAVKKILSNAEILASIGLETETVTHPQALEIWGDKFSAIRGGGDRYMSQAVSPEVRSIDFRQENPVEFEPGFNIVIWDGQFHLHHGLLEYLQTRDSAVSTTP